MNEILSPRQREVLAYIRECVRRQHTAPTVREIARRFGFASPHAATVHLRALERRGYLRREAGLSRNLRLSAALGTIPLVGETRSVDTLAAQNPAVLAWDDLLNVADASAVRVRDSGMRNAGILEGDIVIVRPEPRVSDGTVAVVRWAGDLLVRGVYRTSGGYRLQPENDSERPILVRGPALRHFAVLGPVVAVVRTAPAGLRVGS